MRNYPLAGRPTADVLYWHAGPTEPGDVWSVSGGAVGVRTPGGLHAGRAAGADAQAARAGRGDIHELGRTRVSALVYLPAYHQEGERYPAVVWIWGGRPGSPDSPTRRQPAWLANEGFVVITPNYRGSTGHGVPFMEAVAGDGVGKIDLQDVLAAAEHLKTLPYVELGRGVGIGGHSWGGYLTLMAVTQAPEAFSCAVAGAAIADWTVQQAQTEVRWYDRWLVGGWLVRARSARPRAIADHGRRTDQDAARW